MERLAISSTSPHVSSASDRAGQVAAAGLLEQLMAIFGKAKVAEMYATAKPEDVRRNWAQGLADMRPEELRRGLDACRTRTFAPNIGEFARLCRPALDPEYAFAEAQIGLRARERGEAGEWSHPAVWRAAIALAWEVRAKSYREMRVQWERALAKEFERGWGEGVPPVEKKVEHRPTLSYMPAAVRARLAELGYPMRGAKQS